METLFHSCQEGNTCLLSEYRSIQQTCILLFYYPIYPDISLKCERKKRVTWTPKVEWEQRGPWMKNLQSSKNLQWAFPPKILEGIQLIREAAFNTPFDEYDFETLFSINKALVNSNRCVLLRPATLSCSNVYA